MRCIKFQINYVKVLLLSFNQHTLKKLSDLKKIFPLQLNITHLYYLGYLKVIFFKAK